MYFRGSARGTILSSTLSEGSQGKLGEVSKNSETASRDSPQPPPSESVGPTPSEVFVVDNGGSTGQIQRIFSKDKVCSSNSPTLLDLKVMKHSAEDALRKSMRAILRETPLNVDVEAGKEAYITDVRRVGTRFTEHNSDNERGTPKANPILTDSRQRRTSRQLLTEESASRPRRSIPTKDPSTTALKTVSKTTPVLPAATSVEMPYIAKKGPQALPVSTTSSPFPVIYHTNGHDGCSVSTITGCLSFLTVESTTEYQDPKEEDASLGTKDGANDKDDEEEDSQTDLTFHSESEADDFGSMAQSLPSCIREKYVDEV